MAQDKQLDALLELERRDAVAPGTMPAELKTKLQAYRDQGKAKPLAGGGAATTEGERTAAFLTTRLVGSMRDINDALKESPSASKPSVGASIAGGLFGDTARNFANPVARQRIEAAQMDALDSALTLGTGAAYTKEQLEGYRQAYFPQIGDSDATINDKHQRFRRLIESAKIKSGGAARQIDEALSAFDALPPDAPTVGLQQGIEQAIDQAAGVNDGPSGRTDIVGNPQERSPEFRAGLEALLNDPKTTPDEIKAYWDKNLPGWDASSPTKGQTPPPPMSTDRGENGVVENADAFVRGVADTATLGFADEIAAAGDTLFGDGTMAENLRRQRGVDRFDEQNNPYARGIGQLTGAVVPVGAGAIGAGARGAGQLAAVGGGVGAAYGVGSGETLGERFTGGVRSGLAGAGAGLALGKLSDLYVNRAPRAAPTSRAQAASDLSTAADDLGIDIMPADAGGPVTRMLTTGVGATPGGVQPIVSAARRVQRQGGEALGAMAAREGPVLTKEAAGEAITRGALDFRSSSRASIGRQYDRAANLAGDTRITPTSAIARLNRDISELSEVPGGAEGLKSLTALRDELASRGTVSIQGIRGMRTQLRQQFLKDGLRGSDIERRVNEAIEAAGEDVVASLIDQGKEEAARAYAAADKAWAERIKTLDDVIMPIIGRRGEKSGEQVVDALNAAAKGNNARLNNLFEALPPEEAGAARAQIINSLGQANPGQQGAAGGDFSFDTFLTRWNSIGPSAKNTIFRGENRKAIDQLALIAERSKAAGRYRNYSNTGLVGTTMATGATAMASMATLGKVLAAQYAGGRLLASPAVAKGLLAIAKSKSPSVLQSNIGKLSSIATREPLLRNEIVQVQQRLLQAMNDNVNQTGRAAASPDSGPDQQ